MSNSFSCTVVIVEIFAQALWNDPTTKVFLSKKAATSYGRTWESILLDASRLGLTVKRAGCKGYRFTLKREWQ